MHVRREMDPEEIKKILENHPYKIPDHKAFIYRILSDIGIETDLMPTKMYPQGNVLCIEYGIGDINDITLLYYFNGTLTDDYGLNHFSIWKDVKKCEYFNIDSMQEATYTANFISTLLKLVGHVNERHSDHETMEVSPL